MVQPDEFLRIAELLPDAVVMVSAGRIQAANHKAKEYLGDRCSGGAALITCLSTPPDALRSFLRACARTRNPFIGSLTTNADEPVDYRCEGSVLTPAANGHPAQVMLRFVPKEHAVESFVALKDKIDELRVEIRRREAVEAALRAADRRKDEFLAMLAHELRNPLAPIRSGLDLLQNEQPESDTIGIMQQQVGHLVRLVDDLLDVSRMMRGRIRLEKRPVNMRLLIQHSLDSTRDIFESQDHRLDLDIPETDVWISGDDVRLTQVVTNLLNNAAKYTAPGGEIRLAMKTSGDDVVISVKDSGIGIEADFLPEVFELFSQADKTLDRSAGGLGVGLTVVQQLVHLHGGEVSANSDGLACGSEFVVRLPTIKPPPEVGDDQIESSTVSEPTPTYRVLVVDDSKGAAKMLQRILCSYWDHEVELAHDGFQACAVADAYHPEIIFLDIGLPGMDGYQVAEALRKRPEFAGTTIIAVTGYGTDADRQLGKQAGFDLHLVKPISVDQLRDVFRSLPLRETS